MEAVLAAGTGVLGLVTIVWRDWIEALTGWSPDHHSGSVEVGLIVVLLSASALSAAAAWRKSRQLREAAAAA